MTILGLTPFTLLHVVISLIGILSGFVVMRGLVTSQRLNGWTAIFLFFTFATTITGFLFPITVFTPALGVGIAALTMSGRVSMKTIEAVQRGSIGTIDLVMTACGSKAATAGCELNNSNLESNATGRRRPSKPSGRT